MPCRAEGAEFSPTRKATAPSPCPLVPDVIAIHDALVDADHVQSRVVVTSTVPLAPAAGAEVMEPVAETWHFAPLGAVTETEVDPQPAARTARSHSHGYGRARMAACDSASTLPRKGSTVRL